MLWLDPKEHIVLLRPRERAPLHRVAKILPGARRTIFSGVLFPHVGSHLAFPVQNRHHGRLDTIGNSAYLI